MKNGIATLLRVSGWLIVLYVVSLLIVGFVFGAAWGGHDFVLVVTGIVCLFACLISYFVISRQPILVWMSGVVLAAPIAQMIMLNTEINPQEAHLESFYLKISIAVFLSATAGGWFARNRRSRRLNQQV